MSGSERIEFSGKNVVLVGRMKTMSSTVARQHISSLGGINRNTPRSTTHIFVVGDGGGAKARRAMERFVGSAVFLTEAQFSEALAALEAKTEEPVPLGEALGELRSAFDGTPSKASWDAAVAAIDAAPEAEREAMVRYVASHTERWPDPWSSEGAPRSWASGVGLCVPSSAWLLRLLEGERASEFELLRAVEFGFKKVNGTMGSKVVTHPDLTNLRSLSLGAGNKLSKTFFKKLRTSPQMSNLEALSLYALDEARASELCGPHTLTSLKHVLLRCPDVSMSSSPWGALFEAEWWGQIEGLFIGDVENYYVRRGEESANAALVRALVENMGSLGRLKHLRVEAPDVAWLFESEELLDRIERLSLHALTRQNIVALAERLARPHALAVLDLSGVRSGWSHRIDDELGAVFELLCERDLLRGLEELVLSADRLSDAQRLAFEHACEDVRVTLTWS